MFYFISTLSSLLVFNIFNILLALFFTSVILYIYTNSKLFRYLILILIILISLIAFTSLGKIIISKLENNLISPNLINKKIEWIIVLSGGIDEDMSNEYNQFYLSGSNNCLIETITLHNRFPDIKIVFSGSSGKHFN